MIVYCRGSFSSFQELAILKQLILFSMHNFVVVVGGKTYTHIHIRIHIYIYIYMPVFLILIWCSFVILAVVSP